MPSSITKRDLLRPPHSELAALLLATQDELGALVEEFADGELTADAWADETVAVLEDAHTAAGLLGRHHAGDFSREDEDDRTFGQLVVDEEVEYLDRFRADLIAGRYKRADGTQDGIAIATRAKLYAARLVGTANQAFVLASDPADTFTWILGETEQHCEDCPALAEGSPYTAETLPTVPGANGTECLYNCLCELIRSDGVQGFAHE